MKKFRDKLLGFGCSLVFIVPALIFLIDIVIDVWRSVTSSGGGIEDFILQLILIPFAVLGGINVFRGAGAVIEMDEAKYGSKFKQDWQISLYFVVTILGYFALFYIVGKRF